MIRLSYLIFFIFLLPYSSSAQFEGLVVYDVTYEAIDDTKKEMLSMLPKKSLLYVKGQLSLFEQEVAGGGKQAFYIDAEKGSGILVMQFLGQGYKVEMSQAELESLKKAKELEIVTTAEKKIFSGYNCDKVLALSDSDTLEIYFAPQLKSKSSFPPFSKIDGIPLKYELIRGGVKMTYTAIEVKEMVIEASKFKTAPDIQTMDFGDFARSFAITQ